MFFVATAPSGDGGHVNLSPKGGDNLFRVTGPLGFAYVDLMGSGIETIAHLRENGRIAVMFCAFEGAPKIIRLHGIGTPIQQDDAGFDDALAAFDITDEQRRAVRTVDRRRGHPRRRLVRLRRAAAWTTRASATSSTATPTTGCARRAPTPSARTCRPTTPRASTGSTGIDPLVEDAAPVSRPQAVAPATSTPALRERD